MLFGLGLSRVSLLLALWFAAPPSANGQACSEDVYFLVEATNNLDESDCIIFPILPNLATWTGWNAWRSSVLDILKWFQPLVDAGTIKPGVQLFGENALTIGNYDIAPNFTAAINDLEGRETPLCGNNLFVEVLGEAIDFNEQFSNWIYMGPNNLGSRGLTTRTGVLFIAAPYEQTGVLQNIAERMAFIRPRMDNLIIVSRQLSDAADDVELGKQIRLVACGHETNPCPYVFFLDKPNDFGVPPSLDSFLDVIDRDGCINRDIQFSNYDVVCSTESIRFVIPRLPVLQPITGADLVALNTTCNITLMSDVVGDNLEVVIPLGDCGSIQSTDGNVSTIYQQLMTAPASSYRSVMFNATCEYPTYVSQSIGAFHPQSIILNDTISRNGSFSVQMVLFTTDGLTVVLQPGAEIAVGTNVSLAAVSPLANGLLLGVRMCTATTSADPNAGGPSYNLINIGCPSDPTVTIFQLASNNVLMHFKMFEFASGVGKPNAEKPGVYIHCMFQVCREGVNDGDCSCLTGRKRRNAESPSMREDENSVVKTIGPFSVGKNKKAPSEVEQEVRGVEKPKRIELVIPKSVSGLTPTISHALFLVVMGLVLVLLLRHFVFPATAARATSRYIPYSSEFSPLSYYVKSEGISPQEKVCGENSPGFVSVEADELPPLYQP